MPLKSLKEHIYLPARHTYPRTTLCIADVNATVFGSTPILYPWIKNLNLQ
jgi:hypothetical protein